MSLFLSACGLKGDLYQAADSESEQNILLKEPQEQNIDTIKKPK